MVGIRQEVRQEAQQDADCQRPGVARRRLDMTHHVMAWLVPTPTSLPHTSLRNAGKAHSRDLAILALDIAGIGPRLAYPKRADRLLGIAAQHFRRLRASLFESPRQGKRG